MAGVVVAGLAVLLILWGLRALRASPGGHSGDVATTTPAPGGESAKDAEPSRRWQEFTRRSPPDADRQAAVPRPIERLPRTVGSPFDRAYARMQLGRLGLRFEGVGRGEQTLALISGRVVRVGDRLGDYYVESIDRSGVSLMDPNGIRLDLVPQERSAERPEVPAWNGGGGQQSFAAPSGRGRQSLAAPSGRGQQSFAAPSGRGRRSSGWRSEDGLRARPYFPDGTLDVAATDPNVRAVDRRRNPDVPWDRFTPWPKGPFPQPPSAYHERDVRRRERPGS